MTLKLFTIIIIYHFTLNCFRENMHMNILQHRAAWKKLLLISGEWFIKKTHM